MRRQRRLDGLAVVSEHGGVERQQSEPVRRDELAVQRVVRPGPRAAHDDEPSARVVGVDREPFVRAGAGGAEPGEHVVAAPHLAEQVVAHRQDRGGGQAQLGAVATAGNRLPRALDGTIGRHPRRTLPSGRSMHAQFATATIARVEPLTLTRAVRGPFDYRLRADQADVGVGALLRVPFGGRTTLGVVLELATESELAPERLAEPDAVLPPGVPPDLVELAGWIAAEYCSTPARALTLVLPPGTTPAACGAKLALVAELTDAGAEALDGDARLTDGQRTALEALATRRPRGGGHARDDHAPPARGARTRDAELARPAAPAGVGGDRAAARRPARR